MNEKWLFGLVLILVLGVADAVNVNLFAHQIENTEYQSFSPLSEVELCEKVDCFLLEYNKELQLSKSDRIPSLFVCLFLDLLFPVNVWQNELYGEYCRRWRTWAKDNYVTAYCVVGNDAKSCRFLLICHADLDEYRIQLEKGKRWNYLGRGFIYMGGIYDISVKQITDLWFSSLTVGEMCYNGANLYSD